MIPEVPGVLSADDIRRTGDAIAAQQQPDGLILWYPGGHADPWNHVEAAMALALAGRRAEAEAGFEWLVANQLPNGAWHNYYLADGIEDRKLDTNVCAYIAAGVWHHWLLFADRGFVEALWPTVERAIEFVLSLQTPRGEVIWARHTDGTPWSFALLTGSSSIAHSLRAAVEVAAVVGQERPEWELARLRLGAVIATEPEAFAPKHRWAMDWYYPVLCGVLTGEAGRARLAERRAEFVMPGVGVRCVSDREWVTAAETSECAMAHLAVGERETALELFAWAQGLRRDDGAYWTGLAVPEQVHFPAEETSTYTAAAVVLAADALSDTSAAAGVFRDHPATEPVEATEPD